MTIEPGRIYALQEASDYPYALVTVIENQNDGRNHVLIVYRPKYHKGWDPSSQASDNFSPQKTCLYAILQEQGRLDILIPFIQHLATSKSYEHTCDHFGVTPTSVQQAYFYNGPLSHIPEQDLANKKFLPYAHALGILQIGTVPAPHISL